MKLDKFLTKNLNRAKAFFPTTYLLFRGEAIECVLGDNTRDGTYDNGGYDNDETLVVVVEREHVVGIKDGEKVYIRDEVARGQYDKRKYRVQSVSFNAQVATITLEKVV